MNIRDWYIKNHGDDEMGKLINPNVGFMDCWDMMKNGGDIYAIIGVGDSLIRERIFGELAKRLGVDYDVVYKQWLNN